MKRILLVSLLLATLAATRGTASACAVCMGDPNSYIADATNGTLLMLLGLVGLIFLSTGATAFYLWRCTRRPIPPHVQFVENLTSEPEEC